MSDDYDKIFLSTLKNIFKCFEHSNVFIGKSTLLFNIKYIIKRYLIFRKIISYLFESPPMRISSTSRWHIIHLECSVSASSYIFRTIINFKYVIFLMNVTLNQHVTNRGLA